MASPPASTPPAPVDPSMSWQVVPIGVAHTPYKERFGTPRQATVVQGTLGDGAQRGTIELFGEVVPERALKDLEGFSHIWLIAWLHLNVGWNPMVRPPRGPRTKRGVFATRAPHRPNQLGLSAVRLLGVSGRVLTVEGIDLLDGTPILDVKPYLPYADALPDAAAGWVDALEEAADGPDRPTKVPNRKK